MSHPGDSAQPAAAAHTAAAPLRPETVVVETARPPRTDDAPVNPPIMVSSTYVGTGAVADGARAYGRYSNPTWDPFEEALARLEGCELPGLLYGSGLAAIASALELTAPGGTVIMPEHTYQGALLGAQETAEKGRFDLVTVDIADTEAVLAAVARAAEEKAGLRHTARPGEHAVVLWVESPTNPMLEVADLPALASGAHAHGALVIADNTFATPLLQRPLEVGADVVVHSVTKYLAGHSDVVLGAAVAKDSGVRDALLHDRSIRGGIAGPFEAWLALRGLRTLALRVERACESAQVVAERLADHPAVRAIRYPGLSADIGHERAKAQMSGFGAIISIDLGSAEAAEAAVEACRLWTPATSLGGVESLIERRRRHTAEPLTVPEGLIRLSVGIEHVEDLWADLDRALGVAGA
ncbi:trans-sulfuration enzyme family protein [Brevibacterium album]|uniref:trans-sulfuration enzyme family protein n=1 Tax=Brevibacterium album TaxID=417948 RepID=UPI000551BFCF|nr:aminotransferase class I/II-fold pyridoxal phosphate-dependent enzyme [Brevibacterium album]